MTDHQDCQIALLASLPAETAGHGLDLNDRDTTCGATRRAEAGRLHIALVVLNAIDAPQDYIVQLIGWIMATIPPFAFRIAFSELVASPRSGLLTARDRLDGARTCQEHVAAMLREYGVALPRRALPVPQVTLGYGGRAPLAAGWIGGDGGLVEELVLARGPSGQPLAEKIGRWRLPHRLDESHRAGPPVARRA